jgi:hypothetical protein
MPATDANFTAYKRLSCERKQKADELIGENDIPFSNFPGCSSRRCRVDPATGRVLTGSGSASDRLEQSGFLDATSFRGPSPDRLKAEAEARRRAMEGAAAGPSCAK